MIRPVLAVSLFALAVPLMAQTSTNDDQGAVGGNATNAVQDQPKVMAPAQNPTLTTPDTDDEENDAETTDDASVAVTDSATSTQVNATSTTQTPGGTGGTMQGHTGHGSTTGSTAQGHTGHSGMSGSAGQSTGMSGSTGQGTGAWSGSTGQHTGMGGPFQPAREYPVCSRTITDSCLQTRTSPRPRD